MPLKDSTKVRTAGAMTISISEGMMNMLMGKIIFVGSFSTFSSRAVNCRFRATDACIFNTREIEDPDLADTITDETNMETPSVWQRSAKRLSASSRE